VDLNNSPEYKAGRGESRQSLSYQPVINPAGPVIINQKRLFYTDKTGSATSRKGDIMVITEELTIEELVGMICGVSCGDNPFISVEALRAEILSRFNERSEP